MVDEVLSIKKKCMVSKMALAIFSKYIALVFANKKNESDEDKDKESKGGDYDEK